MRKDDLDSLRTSSGRPGVGVPLRRYFAGASKDFFCGPGKWVLPASPGVNEFCRQHDVYYGEHPGSYTVYNKGDEIFVNQLSKMGVLKRGVTGNIALGVFSTKRLVHLAKNYMQRGSLYSHWKVAAKRRGIRIGPGVIKRRSYAGFPRYRGGIIKQMPYFRKRRFSKKRHRSQYQKKYDLAKKINWAMPARVLHDRSFYGLCTSLTAARTTPVTQRSL